MVNIEKLEFIGPLIHLLLRLKCFIVFMTLLILAENHVHLPRHFQTKYRGLFGKPTKFFLKGKVMFLSAKPMHFITKGKDQNSSGII